MMLPDRMLCSGAKIRDVWCVSAGPAAWPGLLSSCHFEMSLQFGGTNRSPESWFLWAAIGNFEIRILGW